MFSKIKEIILKIKVKSTRAKTANIYLELPYLCTHTHLYLHRNISVKQKTIYIYTLTHIHKCKPSYTQSHITHTPHYTEAPKCQCLCTYEHVVKDFKHIQASLDLLLVFSKVSLPFSLSTMVIVFYSRLESYYSNFILLFTSSSRQGIPSSFL